MNYTFLKLAEETLKAAKTPLTSEEIWKKSAEYGLQEKCASTGLTPWRSIGAQIYVDMKKNENTIFYKANCKPIRFGLKNITNSISPSSNSSGNEHKFYERDLHKLLSAYVFSEQHFCCYTKTIYHEKSGKKKKGQSKWLHPDIVGVYFPFEDYHNSTVSIIETFSDSAIKLFSFEMKIKITLADLREYYFQAVSNSSWAHEGYLAALEYENSENLLDEMRKLSSAFGIGFIKLNAENIEQSEIIVSAKTKDKIDWEMVNRLAEDNQDFKGFIDSIVEDNRLKKVKSKYDDVLDSDALKKYIKEKHII